MHVCNCVWLLLVFIVDDVFLSMYNSIRTTTLKGLIVLGHVASIVMPLMHSSLYWNGVMYTAIVLVLCYVRMVTYLYVVQVINYLHRIVQVVIYCISYLYISSRLHHEMC